MIRKTHLGGQREAYSGLGKGGWDAMKIQRIRYKIIDAHAHVGPVYNFFVPFNDGHGMVKSMDLLGIETTVISSNAAITADVCFGNQYTHEVIKTASGRFLGYFVVNPHYPEKMGEDISRYFSIDESRRHQNPSGTERRLSNDWQGMSQCGIRGAEQSPHYSIHTLAVTGWKS